MHSPNQSTFYEVFFSFLASLRDWAQISLITSVNCSVAKFTPSLSGVKVVVSVEIDVRGNHLVSEGL